MNVININVSMKSWRNAVMLLLGMFILINGIAFAQTKKTQIEKLKSMHFEVPNDKYVPVLRENMERTQAYTYKSVNFFTTQVNIDEDGNNIVGDAGNEPSIAIDPTDPNRIVIGWREFGDINSDFRQAGYAYSTDAGQTWTFPGPIDPTVFRSDPVLDFDAEGNFYYNSLTADEAMNFECKVYRILDGGVEWDEGMYAYGGDKQWMRVDRTEGVGNGNVYAFWSSYASACDGGFTRSTNGDSYEQCIMVEEDPIWGTLAVGPNGELYVAGTTWVNGIVLVKSTTAQNAGNPTTWDFHTVVDLGGELAAQSPINPDGLVGQTWVDVDVSNGPGHGNIYMLASVARSSNNDPADVMFTKSTDGGQSFEAPVRINNDEGNNNYQWFGTMSVAPNGRIDVVWLDTRDAPAGSQYLSALYYSYSVDQGETWSENEKLSDSFDPHIGWPQQQKMGDYFDMVSDNEGAHLAWANTLNNGEDVYYAYITPAITGIVKNKHAEISLKNFPNPFNSETTISFFLSETSVVLVEIYGIMGKKVKTLTNQKMEKGNHTVVWNGCNDMGCRLAEGFYTLKIRTNDTEKAQKILMLDQ
jgi:hypothetical protein